MSQTLLQAAIYRGNDREVVGSGSNHTKLLGTLLAHLEIECTGTCGVLLSLLNGEEVFRTRKTAIA